jgi:hypothetical protein
MTHEPNRPRRTPQWLRRSLSSPENRSDDEMAPGKMTPRDNPKYTRPIKDDAPEAPRLALSPVIGQTINVMNERDEQRHKLINTLILVQLLITAAIALGYHDQPGLIFPIMLASVGVYLVAFVTGYLLKNAPVAAYILVFGGGLAVAALVGAATLAGNPEEIGHLALFFLAVMLEAGLLLTPEITVIVVTAASTLTGASLLLVAITRVVAGPQIYLIMLYTLSPMVLTGIISWLLSHYIYTTTVNVQHAQELEFRQAQYQQMKTHEREREEDLDESIGAIQSAIAQAISGDYAVRVPVSAGDLEVVERSLNLLLDTFDSMVQAQQENARMQGAVGPITEVLNRWNDSITPVHTIKTDTPFDNVSVMVTRIADNYNRRLARLQEHIGNLVRGVAHSRDGLANASGEFDAAKRQAGALVSRADTVQASLQKQLELLVKARRMMATLLPPEITQTAEPTEGGNPALRGLGIGVEMGLTREFELLAPTTPEEAGIKPLTMPLPALHVDGVTDDQQPTEATGSNSKVNASDATKNSANDSKGKASKSSAPGDEAELPAELVEVWHLLLQIGDELNQQERTVATFAQELGVLSRTVRKADTGIGWTLTALDTVQRSSDGPQSSSAQHLLPENPEDDASDGQDSGGYTPRRTNTARPLWTGSDAPDNGDQPPPRGSLSGSDLLGGTLDDAPIEPEDSDRPEDSGESDD